MPNHFHLELKQIGKKDIEFFMRSLITKYSKYFNKKYSRVGPLFQSRYKAVLIQNTEYLLYLSKYIHLNPVEPLLQGQGQSLEEYPWSSYPVYLNRYTTSWLKVNFIKTNFLVNGVYLVENYKKFVEQDKNEEDPKSKEFKNLRIDS
jgi:hypothetical protein